MENKGFFHDIKIQLIVLGLVIVAELIGITPVNLGAIRFSLLPMLYALVLGMALTRVKSLITYDDMVMTSPYIGISVMFLSAYMGCTIGPNLPKIAEAGPALILQELGNLGTVFFSLPIAVLILKMDRTAVGSGFSTSREGSLAIVADLYGLDSPEGRGVMGSYITGTLLGTIFNGILASLLMGISWFRPEALAMAAGTGSASMMSAAIAPLVEGLPHMADELTAYAASSQVLTSMDGTYMSLFLAIPLAEWLYKTFKGKDAEPSKRKSMIKKAEDVAAQDLHEEGEEPAKSGWFEMVRVLIFSGAFALIANWISTWKKGEPVTPIEALPMILVLFGIIIVSNILKKGVDKIGLQLPAIMYISIIGTLVSSPISPIAGFIAENMKLIGLLPLCTPILAYAGIATGKDMAAFKQQGIKIIIITLFALAGTYVGSAIIANVVLGMM